MHRLVAAGHEGVMQEVATMAPELSAPASELSAPAQETPKMQAHLMDDLNSWLFVATSKVFEKGGRVTKKKFEKGYDGPTLYQVQDLDEEKATLKPLVLERSNLAPILIPMREFIADWKESKEKLPVPMGGVTDFNKNAEWAWKEVEAKVHP